MPELVSIDCLDMEELRPYACTSEVQLLRYFEPAPGIFIAESPRVIARAMEAGYEPLSMLVERRLAGEAAEVAAGIQRSETVPGERRERRETARQLGEILAQCGEIPVYMADMDLLVRITGFHLTQGVLCAMRRRRLPAPEMVCADAARVAVLEDVVNPTNVGAIFRAAAALNFDAVLLTSACCDPLYRRAIRVSMGTVFQIPWTYMNRPAPDYVQDLKRMGFATAAMALRDDTISVDDPKLSGEKRLAVILGTEGEGLKAGTIDACDHTVKIPMAHGVDSLNVAAAAAVAFWELGRR